MSFWKSVTNFLSNPVVRGVSALTGAAGAAGAFDGLGSTGDTITKLAGVANIATGGASALNPNQSGLSRLLGAGQVGLGGFNLLQGGLNVPGLGKVGGFGSVSNWLAPAVEEEIGPISSGGGGFNNEWRRVYSEPLPPPSRQYPPLDADRLLDSLNGGPSRQYPPLDADRLLDSLNGGGSEAAPVLGPYNPPDGIRMQPDPFTPYRPGVTPPPGIAPPTNPLPLEASLQFPAGDEILAGGSGAGESLQVAQAAPSPPPGVNISQTPPPPSVQNSMPPASVPGRLNLGRGEMIVGQTDKGLLVRSADGLNIRLASFPAPNTSFLDRIVDRAVDDPLKAAAATAMLGGTVAQMFAPSVADIYNKMASQYSPDSANAQQFMADFKARATTEAQKQHANLSADLRSKMADRGMLDSSVYAAAQAELDKGLTEIMANMPTNAWQAWNQYARSMGATQIQTAQSAALISGTPQSFANVSRIIARTA